MSVEVGQPTRSLSFSDPGSSHEVHRRISSPVGLRKRGNYLRQRGYENYRANSSVRIKILLNLRCLHASERQWQRIDYGVGGANSPVVRQLPLPSSRNTCQGVDFHTPRVSKLMFIGIKLVNLMAVAFNSATCRLKF